MRQQGKIIINKVKKGYEYKVELTNKKGKPYLLQASDYEFDNDLKDKECEVEVKHQPAPTKIVWIKVDGNEIPKKESKEKHHKPQRHISAHIKEDNKMKTKEPSDSFNIKKTKIPEYIRNSGLASIDNFHLKLNRAARFEGDKFLFWRAEKRSKTNYQEPLEIKPDFSKVDFEKIKNIYEKSIKSLYSEDHILKLEFKPDWRMIVGLGNESIYEVSMTLHHIYGFPYIPASAIKGVTRNWVIVHEFGEDKEGNIDLKRAEMRALQNKYFCDIFGCPENESYIDESCKKIVYKTFYEESRKGNIIFFDALPTKSPTIEIDIMNPHYGDYYAEKKPPADYLSPNPIPFLTVTETPFQFYFALSKKLTKYAFNEKKYQPDNEKKKEQKILDEISNYLKKALTQQGIGAKTAVGYGRMSN